MSWTLRCAWCPYHIVVGDRGARGHDQGAGVEAANVMQGHIADRHPERTWREYTAALYRSKVTGKTWTGEASDSPEKTT